MNIGSGDLAANDSDLLVPCQKHAESAQKNSNELERKAAQDHI